MISNEGQSNEHHYINIEFKTDLFHDQRMGKKVNLRSLIKLYCRTIYWFFVVPLNLRRRPHRIYNVWILSNSPFRLVILNRLDFQTQLSNPTSIDSPKMIWNVLTPVLLHFFGIKAKWCYKDQKNMLIKMIILIKNQ